MNGLEVRTGRRGRGVFATRAFRKGEVVELCHTLAMDDEDVEGVMRDYVFSSRTKGKVLIMFGYGMLYNHSPNPTLWHRTGPQRMTIEFVAARDIEPGEELTHDYGAEYWADRGKKPK